MEKDKIENSTELNNDEAVVKETNEKETVDKEIVNKETNKKEIVEDNNKNNKKLNFVTFLGRSVTDTIVMVAISYIIFFLVEQIMKVAGYQIVSIYRFVFFFIIYIVISIFYKSVCSITKSGKTVGEKFFK